LEQAECVQIVLVPLDDGAGPGIAAFSTRTPVDTGWVENAAMPDRTYHPVDKDDLDALGLLKGRLPGARDALRNPDRALTCWRAGTASQCACRTSRPKTADLRDDGRGETTGVFQIEVARAYEHAARLIARTSRPRRREVAIIRPGPIQGHMGTPNLRRRQGLETVSIRARA